MEILNLDDIRHGVRVANLSNLIAMRLNKNISKDEIYISSVLHDIGKAYLDPQILNKPGKLNLVERKHIESHAIHSYNEIINLGYSRDFAINTLHHHESFDGNGYPKGLKGEDIPLVSRIIKITDIFDALTCDRVYRTKMNIEKALTIMIKEQKSYDPLIFNIFLKIIEEKGDKILNISYEGNSKKKLLIKSK